MKIMKTMKLQWVTSPGFCVATAQLKDASLHLVNISTTSVLNVKREIDCFILVPKRTSI